MKDEHSGESDPAARLHSSCGRLWWAGVLAILAASPAAVGRSGPAQSPLIRIVLAAALGCALNLRRGALVSVVTLGVLLASISGLPTGTAIDAQASTPTPSPTTASPSTTPIQPSPHAIPRVDVILSPDGPWFAELIGFNDSQVAWVQYWIRDAKRRWRSSEVIATEPFQAPIRWWEDDNGGFEAVTAHVLLRSGRAVQDPGGWHWLNGLHADPQGTAEVLLNPDGSAGATYRPRFHASLISKVKFWLRSLDGHWTMAAGVAVPSGGSYSVGRLDGSQTLGWNRADAALSVHVVWPNGSEFADPVPWVWSEHFRPAPTPTAAPPVAVAPTVAPPAISAPNDPYADAKAAGATAVCADGTWSHSHTRSGTCSHHGGVHWWTGNLGPAGPGEH